MLEVTELDVWLPKMIPLTPMTTFILLNGTDFTRIESYLYSIVSWIWSLSPIESLSSSKIVSDTCFTHFVDGRNMDHMKNLRGLQLDNCKFNFNFFFFRIQGILIIISESWRIWRINDNGKIADVRNYALDRGMNENAGKAIP